MICGILSLHHDQLAFEQQVAVPWILSSCTFSTVQDQRSPELQLKRETEIKRRTTEQKTRPQNQLLAATEANDYTALSLISKNYTNVRLQKLCGSCSLILTEKVPRKSSLRSSRFSLSLPEPLADDDDLKKLSLSLFFCLEKASNSLARVAAKCKKTEKNQNSGGKFTNRKCQTVQPLRVR